MTPVSLAIRRSVAVVRTPRVMQAEGLFDVPPAECAERVWTHRLDLPDAWSVGVVVGPSGSGKSTLAREAFGQSLVDRFDWPADRSVLDGFPAALGIRDVTGLLCAVGFGSPPAWVRPFHALSTGEQFRVHLARTLAERPGLAVVDEFTSVVDRTVARVASAAVAKAVRRGGGRFVAVTCHYDVLDWLEPDWVYEPHAGAFTANTGPDGPRGSLWRRPPVELVVRRVRPAAWELFKPHHYLSAGLHASAQCYAAFVRLDEGSDARPAAFAAALPFPHADRPGWREHRCVCLPDFQGVGIGHALSEFVAALYAATGKPYTSTTSHPAMIRHRTRSPLWKMKRPPGQRSLHRGLGPKRASSVGRLTAGFEYVGPPRAAEAEMFLKRPADGFRQAGLSL